LNEKLTFWRSDNGSPAVLVAPLDWGLGHASRCVPVIKECLNTGCEVIIASSGPQKALLLQEFPGLTCLDLPAYGLKYGKNRFLTTVGLILQVPKILTAINREKKWLANFIKHKHLDLIISDNRYGLHHPSLQSVLIIHQLYIKTPFGKIADRLLQKINYRYIRNFSCCWVPDAENGYHLAGRLSHPTVMPDCKIRYLGPLSRIRKETVPVIHKLLVLLSGPEPQRSVLEQEILRQLEQQLLPAVVVRGLPGSVQTKTAIPAHITLLNHAGSEAMQRLINESAIVLSRSGYSTIMDLLPLGKKCIFIPTPGQTEQEYLAAFLNSKGWCCTGRQDNFDLAGLVKAAGGLNIPDLSMINNEHLLTRALHEALDSISSAQLPGRK
jgi:hypothetical protein